MCVGWSSSASGCEYYSPMDEMSPTTKALLLLAGMAMFFGYQMWSQTLNNRDIPGLKDGIACLVEQLAEHRVGNRVADDAAAAHHGYTYSPETKSGYRPPPEPTGDDLCTQFLRDN